MAVAIHQLLVTASETESAFPNTVERAPLSNLLVGAQEPMKPEYSDIALELQDLPQHVPVTVSAASSTIAIISFAAPEKSPYSGATFKVDVTKGEHGLMWVWGSPIYHPVFGVGKSLCHCLLAGDRNQTKTPTDVMKDILVLLENPHYSPKCGSCSVDAVIFAEAQSDPAFFMRKARVRTPGATPLSDDELRTPCSLNFDMLLTTGLYSDIKMVVNRTVFRCHRTILAARSPVLAQSFNMGGDGGVMRVRDTNNPSTFARFLQYMYSSRLQERSSLSVEDHLDLYQLALRYRVLPLANYHMACIASLVTTDNVYSLLDRVSIVGEPMLVGALNKYIEHNNIPARPSSELPSPLRSRAVSPVRLSDHASGRRSRTQQSPTIDDDLSPKSSRSASPHTGPTRRHVSHEGLRHTPY